MSRMEDQTQGSAGAGEQSGRTGQLKDTAQQVQQNLRELGNQAREAATQQYDQLRQQATQYYETGRQRAMDYEQSLEQYVQEQPIKALLIAGGVGLLLGVLWKRS